MKVGTVVTRRGQDEHEQGEVLGEQDGLLRILWVPPRYKELVDPKSLVEIADSFSSERFILGFSHAHKLAYQAFEEHKNCPPNAQCSKHVERVVHDAAHWQLMMRTVASAIDRDFEEEIPKGCRVAVAYNVPVRTKEDHSS